MVKVGNDQDIPGAKKKKKIKNKNKKIKIKIKKIKKGLGTNICTKRTHCKPSEHLFPNRRPLSYPNYTSKYVVQVKHDT